MRVLATKQVLNINNFVGSLPAILLELLSKGPCLGNVARLQVLVDDGLDEGQRCI